MSEQSVIIHQIARTEKERLQISVDHYHGKRIVNIRVWVMKKDGTWVPTRRGVNVYPDELWDLWDSLDFAAEEFGIILEGD